MKKKDEELKKKDEKSKATIERLEEISRTWHSCCWRFRFLTFEINEPASLCFNNLIARNERQFRHREQARYIRHDYRAILRFMIGPVAWIYYRRTKRWRFSERHR